MIRNFFQFFLIHLFVLKSTFSVAGSISYLHLTTKQTDGAGSVNVICASLYLKSVQPFHPPTDACINNQTDLDFLIPSKLLTLGWPFSSCSLSLLMTPSAVWTSTSPLAALSWWPDTRFIRKAGTAWPRWPPTSIMATVWLLLAPRVDDWKR